MTRTLRSLMVIPLLAPAVSLANPARESAEEIAKKSHLASYYPAKDNTGSSVMRIVEKGGKARVREMVGLRLDQEEGGNQKYYVYFKKPADVARLSYVVHKKADSNDSRWIYVPSVDLIRPIVADDKTLSFVGSDFTYEDISGRHWSQDVHKRLKDAVVDGKPHLVVESVPKEPYPGYDRKVSFIDSKTYLAMKTEFYRKGTLARVQRTRKVEVIQGFPTAMFVEMEDMEKGRKTTMEFKDVKYDVGIKDAYFTERYLKAPPREFIR